MDAVIEKHLNNPLVVEIMEKYKELEKQPGYKYQDQPLSFIMPEVKNLPWKIDPVKPISPVKKDVFTEPEDERIKGINRVLMDFANGLEKEEN